MMISYNKIVSSSQIHYNQNSKWSPSLVLNLDSKNLSKHFWGGQTDDDGLFLETDIKDKKNAK